MRIVASVRCLLSPCPLWCCLRMTPGSLYITREDVAQWQVCQLRHIWRQHQTGFHPAQEALADWLLSLVLRNVLDALLVRVRLGKGQTSESLAFRFARG
jgi:hypothetical protein